MIEAVHLFAVLALFALACWAGQASAKERIANREAKTRWLEECARMGYYPKGDPRRQPNPGATDPAGRIA